MSENTERVEINHSTNKVADVRPTPWSPQEPSRPQSTALAIAEQQEQLTNTSTTSYTPTAGPTGPPESWYFRHSGTPSDISVNTLSEKWMNSKQVAQLARESGVTPIAGKFGDIEISQLDAAIEKYRTDHSLTDGDIRQIILYKGKNKTNQPFWADVSAAVTGRPIKQVRMHLQRRYNPSKQQGKWTSSDDKALVDAVEDVGQKWTEVSSRVGRTDKDCRDRYRNHLADRRVRKTGSWSYEEEKQLMDIVSEMGCQQPQSTFWTEVSNRMGKTRGRQQCRQKWLLITKSSDSGSNAELKTIIWTGPESI